MREATITLCFAFCCRAALGSPAETIKPGISFDVTKSILQKHGYEVDPHYPLAMAPPKGQALEFCPIDKNIILLIKYGQSTQQVVSLGIAFVPDHPMNKDQRVVREALEIRFEGEGVYVLKLKRIESRARIIDRKSSQ
jgi:hypothetical protein